MNNKPEIYFTTGEFAAMFHISKHTLFYYDEIGIFSPAYRGENGYRYYTVWQIEFFQVILMLRDLGMSLEDIRNYVQKKSPEKYYCLLCQKENAIKREMRKLKKTLTFLHSQLRHIEKAASLEMNHPVLRQRAREYLVVTDVYNCTEKAVAAAFMRHYDFCEENQIPAAAFGQTYKGEDLEQGCFDRYDKIYTKLGKKKNDISFVIKPEGLYLEFCYEGYQGNLEYPYSVMQAYARERRVSLDVVWYEDFILDELFVDGYDQYVVRASVRVLQKE